MKKPLPIIFSSYDTIGNPYYSGGGAAAVHAIAKRFAKTQPVLVLGGTYPEAKTRVIDKVGYCYIGVSIFGPRIGQLIFQLFLLWYAKRLAFSVWFENFTPPFSTSFLPWFTKRPVIGLCHALSGQEMSQRYHLPFDRVEQFGLKQYRWLIAPSRLPALAQIGSYPRLTIIPNGIDQLPAIAHKRIYPKPYFLAIGRIDVSQKGLDLLLEAYAAIAPKTAADLVIIGSGTKDQEHYLRQLLMSHGLTNRVVLKKRISGNEKYTWMRQAQAVVIPSRFESFSMTALETVAAGGWPITFAIDGIAWLPKVFATKVRPFDTKALAKAMTRGNQSQRADRLLRKKFIDQYYWDTIFQGYQAIANEALMQRVP